MPGQPRSSRSITPMTLIHYSCNPMIAPQQDPIQSSSWWLHNHEIPSRLSPANNRPPDRRRVRLLLHKHSMGIHLGPIHKPHTHDQQSSANLEPFWHRRFAWWRLCSAWNFFNLVRQGLCQRRKSGQTSPITGTSPWSISTMGSLAINTKRSRWQIGMGPKIDVTDRSCWRRSILPTYSPLRIPLASQP